MQAPRHPHTPRGFSLIELLTVMGIAAVLSTMAVSAFRTNTANQVSTGVQKTISMLTMARTEAAVRRLPTRVMIATKWNANQKAEYRAFSIWRTKDDKPTEWQQISGWEYLPDGVIFDPDGPGSIDNHDSTKVTYLFDSTLGNGTPLTGSYVPDQVKFIEFLPNGTVRTPSSTIGDDFMLRLAEGYRDNSGTVKLRKSGDQDNFADVVTYGLVGRIKAYRP